MGKLIRFKNICTILQTRETYSKCLKFQNFRQSSDNRTPCILPYRSNSFASWLIINALDIAIFIVQSLTVSATIFHLTLEKRSHFHFSLKKLGEHFWIQAMNNTGLNLTECETANCTVNKISADLESTLCITMQVALSRDHSTPFISKLSSMVVNILLSIFATITNALIITVLVKKEVLRTGANLILTSMAVSDLLVGVTVQPLNVIYTIFDLVGKDWCTTKKAASFLASLCVAASLMNTCFFALDRCFATLLPYLYLEEIIYKKYLTTIVIGWIFLVLLVLMTLVSLIGESLLLNLLTWLFFLSFLLIIVSYSIIYYAIKAQRKKIRSIGLSRRARYVKEDFDSKQGSEGRSERAMTISNGAEKLPNYLIETSFSTLSWKGSYDLEKVEIEERKRARKCEDRVVQRQRATSYTVGVILAVFMLCYLPLTVFNIVRELVEIDKTELNLAYSWTNMCVLLNSSLNPIIYCIRVNNIRREIKNLIHRPRI